MQNSELRLRGQQANKIRESCPGEKNEPCLARMIKNISCSRNLRNRQDLAEIAKARDEPEIIHIDKSLISAQEGGEKTEGY